MGVYRESEPKILIQSGADSEKESRIEEVTMPAITGSFSGNVNVQTSLAVSDQSNHELGVAEIHCTQKSSDGKWNKAQMTYWGVTDVVDGKGSQRGYFVTVHGEQGRDWGTLEGEITTRGGEIGVEGTWQFTGGSGEFKKLTGNGTFKIKMTSPKKCRVPGRAAASLQAPKPKADESE
jgi:hypothetical protein